MKKHDRHYSTFESNKDFYAQEISDAVIKHRTVGRIQAGMMHSMQQAGDWSNNPMPDLVLLQHKGASYRARANVGLGVYEGEHYAGNFVVIPPDVSTEIEVYDPHEVLLLAIPYQALKAFFYDSNMLPEDGFFGAVHYGSRTDYHTTNIMDRLWQHVAEDSPYSTLYADQLIIHLIMRLLFLKGDTPVLFKGGLSFANLKRVVDIMHNELSDDFGLERLAKEVELSTWYFIRAFKYSTGMTPYEYFTWLRINKAKLLLEDRMLSITDVARLVGYKSTQALARVFIRHVGCNPRHYRQSHLK
tara:strand:+ start:3157 stop:4059 length:903 start_codon:yes stop_codon:yes gene_type:complete